MGFNEEIVVRAVAASRIPIISAVGHETDWTLIDLVADMRAPTPTGAAEIAVPVKADLEATLASLGARLKAAVLRNFERKRQAARAAARALPSPDQLLALPRRRLDEATSRLGRALSVSVDRKRARLQGQRLTPATLSRRINEARARERLRAMLSDTLLPAEVEPLLVDGAKMTESDACRLAVEDWALLELTTSAGDGTT